MVAYTKSQQRKKEGDRLTGNRKVAWAQLEPLISVGFRMI